MAHLLLFLKGLGVGLAIAAPVGPIGALCVRRTLTQGRLMGLVSGLGAAAADGVYGAVAGLGLTSVAELLIDYETQLRLGGGAFLVLIGIRVLAQGPEEKQLSVGRPARALGAFLSCFLLTLTNPMTVIAFVAIFAGLGLVSHGGDYGLVAILILGVFLGSAFWWSALSVSVGLLRDRLTGRATLWMHRASGAIILGFGMGAVVAGLG